MLKPDRKTFGMWLMLAALALSACGRQDDWLDVKRSKNDVVPSSLKDLQAVLDNTTVMNRNYMQMGLGGADNHYITDVNLNSVTAPERNSYLWAPDIFEGGKSFDWQYAYQMVAYANIVLEGLEKAGGAADSSPEYDQIRGTALFHRSFAFYQVAQLFCRPYDAATAVNDPGIPLRLSSDVNISSTRATVAQTYDQIVHDLQQAVGLLPEVPLYRTRPSKAAANGLLAKVFLSMDDYNRAFEYANAALSSFNTLIDFNGPQVSASLTYRFPAFSTGNPEIIFWASTVSYLSLFSSASGVGYADEELYGLYSDNDLRKTLFFRDYGGGKVKFQGNYTGTSANFGGIATNEIYLIRAECYARSGNVPAAMNDLNTLLVKRYKNDGSFSGLDAATADQALQIVLEERRKELPYTGQLRWEDLRRLNKDARFAKDLHRTAGGIYYTLPANDPRYVFPLPDIEIQLYNLEQNER